MVDNNIDGMFVVTRMISVAEILLTDDVSVAISIVERQGDAQRIKVFASYE